jgi:predicted amidohydrolase YtcJ
MAAILPRSIRGSLYDDSGKNLSDNRYSVTNITQANHVLATAANKWFIWEDDLGSIEVGNHGDIAVLDRDFFTIPEDDIPKIRSVMTVVGGKIVHEG